jgi:DNA-binding NarL/FixJ family response regulator
MANNEMMAEFLDGSGKFKAAIIADDHRIMREGLRSLLDKSGRFECIAEADDGYQAVNWRGNSIPIS